MEIPLSDSTLKALITLLDDPDENISKHAEDKILEVGKAIIPKLEEYWEELEDVVLQNKVEQLIHQINFQYVFDSLNKWKEQGGKNLLDALIILSKYKYPQLDEAEIVNVIKSIRIQVWLELNYNLTALEKVRILNHVFFTKFGFKPNESKYNAAENSFISEVLRQKKGNPVSLSSIYMIVARELDIPIYGINLPQHFVLAYLDDSEKYQESTPEETPVLFFINVFNQGVVFGTDEVDRFLSLLKIEKQDKFYKPCTNVNIIARFMNNLISIYSESGEKEKLNELIVLRTLFREENDF